MHYFFSPCPFPFHPPLSSFSLYFSVSLTPLLPYLPFFSLGTCPCLFSFSSVFFSRSPRPSFFPCYFPFLFLSPTTRVTPCHNSSPLCSFTGPCPVLPALPRRRRPPRSPRARYQQCRRLSTSDSCSFMTYRSVPGSPGVRRVGQVGLGSVILVKRHTR